jgi:hypothetical protein
MLSHHGASGIATRHGQAQNENYMKQHRRYTRRFPQRSSGLLSLLVVLVLLSLFASAAAIPHGDRHARSTPLPAISADSSLLLNARPVPVPLLMPPAHNGVATRTTSAPPSKRSLDLDPKASDTNFQIPTPFDSGFSKNFSSGCEDFLTRMLKSDTITTCHPISLMLQVGLALVHASPTFG